VIPFDKLAAGDMHDLVGFIPQMLSDDDPMSARDQLDCGYQHGGGWSAFSGFEMSNSGSLTYRGDQPLRPVAIGRLRDERIIVYPLGWVAVVQPDGAFEVSRMD